MNRRQFLAALATARLVRPLEATAATNPSRDSIYRFVAPGSDEYAAEAQAARVTVQLNRLLETKSLPLAEGFRGSSPMPVRYRQVAADVSVAEYAAGGFADGLKAWLDSLGAVSSARFYPLAGNLV